jgi:hypothetical protein
MRRHGDGGEEGMNAGVSVQRAMQKMMPTMGEKQGDVVEARALGSFAGAANHTKALQFCCDRCDWRMPQARSGRSVAARACHTLTTHHQLLPQKQRRQQRK